DAGEHSGLAISNAHLDITAVPPILTVDAVARAPFDKPDLFVEFKPYLSAAPPSITYSDDRHRAHMSLTAPNATVDQIGQKVVMTLVDGPRAMETTVMIDQPGDPAKRTGRSLPLVLLLALIGGAILNLMPCVLPVLSLKLVSVVSHGGSTPEAVRAGFIASALGILFSFLVLATGTIILKKAGVAVGWGMHFQQPAFLVFMSAVLILFALNLFGLFEIRLPRFLMDAPGCVKTDNSSLAGHFVTGAFATLLATPCSAPFLGTATGFALTRGVIEIVAIFLTLGLGMSLPWLIVAIRPDLATKLPKPGPWMLWLKRAMGVCLMATALWLTAVLSVQAGAARAWIAFLLIMAGSASATVAIRQIGRTRQRFVIGAGVALVLAFFVAGGGHIGKLEIKTGWVAFDPVAIPAYVDAGKVVFVDVTADWCLTCQANKALVTGRGAVAERLASPDVVAMRADWTHRDSHIYAFITRHGRFGIPVDVVFGPGARDGILLPEILTTGRTLKAIETAKMSDE
ncbi:MAG: thioredoxin family protein, partial [Pseudomonadota bacterium]|nr:thioredoxin family protein [Pseudomonadota bacterium]